MPTCAACNKNFLMGGVKDQDARFCSANCRFQDFYGRLTNSLGQAAAADPEPLPEPEPTAIRKESGEEIETSPVVDGAKDLIIISVGLGTVVAVTGLIQWIYTQVKYPFFGQTFLFVFPVGAFLCGMVAGCGFWVALRRLDRLPTKLTYLAAGLGGVIGYIMIYFFTWWGMDLGAAKLRNLVTFPQFLQVMVENQAVQFRNGPQINLGMWGYARFAINVVGSVFGVLTMVAIGGGKAYCPTCRRYLRTVGKQARASSDPEATGAMLHPVIFGVVANRLQEALDLHAASSAPGVKGYWTTTIAVEACPGCGKHQAKLTASVPGEQGAQPVQGFAFQGTSDSPVFLHG
jgi:hypothetical protein